MRNPFTEHIFGQTSSERRVPRPPVVREGDVMADGSILLAGAEETIPTDELAHSLPPGTRVAVIQANNRVYMLGQI